MNTDNLTRQQRCLLLYLEDRAVDHCCSLDPKALGLEDRDQLATWHHNGLIRWNERTRVCQITLPVLQAAHDIRRQRAERAGAILLPEIAR